MRATQCICGLLDPTWDHAAFCGRLKRRRELEYERKLEREYERECSRKQLEHPRRPFGSEEDHENRSRH